MRNLSLLDQYRKDHPILGIGDSDNGFFMIPGTGCTLRVIASNGAGWDHVSVSTNRKRCPNWPEMKKIKEMFFKDEEPAYQIFPPKKDYINCHPYTLHWWRPQKHEIKLPHNIMVGP